MNGPWNALPMWREFERTLGKSVERGVNLGLALVPPVPITPAQMLEFAVEGVGEQFLHKRIRVRVGGSPITMTPVVLHCDFHSIGLATGQFAALHMTAEDVRWGRESAETAEAGHPGAAGLEFQTLTVVCRDMRLRSVAAPTLIVGSVEVHAAISARHLREQISRRDPRLVADIGRDRVIRLHWARAQRLGHLIVEPRVTDGLVEAQPVALVVAGRRIGLRVRPRPIPIARLPYGLRVTAITVGDRALHVHGVSERARERLTNVPLGDLVRLVRSAIKVL